MTVQGILRAVRDRIRVRSLRSAVIIGALLLAVPLAFDAFPEVASLHWKWRVAISVVWVLLVIDAVWSVAVRDRYMDDVTQRLTQDKVELRRQLRAGAFAASLSALLRPEAHQIPESFEFFVYVYDVNTSRLMPIHPRWTGTDDDVRIFEPGKGATGTAWEQSDLVIVKGDAVSNTKYGLTAAQQTHWAGYRRALSYPLYKDLSRQFGTLTALSRDEDDFFDAPAGQALFKHLSNVVAVLLLTVADVPSLENLS